jgi:AcrR family transcriptional regulator
MGRPRSFDEERVLHAIRDQFWDAGYAATSLQDLMRVSGLGKGSLYATFGDKHEVFLRALHSYCDDSHGYMREALAAYPRALDALRVVVMAPAADPTGSAAHRGCLMGNTTYELASADPEIAAQARQNYETSTAILADFVARAQREGDIAAETDATAFARVLLTAQQGLVFMGRTGMDVTTLEATARSLAEQLLPDPAS